METTRTTQGNQTNNKKTTGRLQCNGGGIRAVAMYGNKKSPDAIGPWVLASGFYPWPGPGGPGLGPSGPEFFFKDAPPFLFERLLKVFEKLLGSIRKASGFYLEGFWALFKKLLSSIFFSF